MKIADGSAALPQSQQQNGSPHLHTDPPSAESNATIEPSAQHQASGGTIKITPSPSNLTSPQLNNKPVLSLWSPKHQFSLH